MSLERRFDIASFVGMAFVAGWLCSSGFYSLTTLWQDRNRLQHVQTAVIPKLVASRNCEKVRADKAVGALANQAADAIPANCPPPPPVPKALPIKK